MQLMFFFYYYNFDSLTKTVAICFCYKLTPHPNVKCSIEPYVPVFSRALLPFSESWIALHVQPQNVCETSDF